MFLSYLSLAILLIGLMLVFYTFIYIHDIPYEQAKKRKHTQAEAIHVACWLSLFTQFQKKTAMKLITIAALCSLAFIRAQAADITPAEARAIAKEAYIYGFPLVDNYRIQHAYFVDKQNPEYKGPFNR